VSPQREQSDALLAIDARRGPTTFSSNSMTSVLNTLLVGWGHTGPECHIRRLAALEEGEIVCSEYGACRGSALSLHAGDLDAL
jgi:hypothetical protein